MPTLFQTNGALAGYLETRMAKAQTEIEGVPDADAIGRERHEWLDALVRRWRIAPPLPAGDGSPDIEDLGRRVRDVTNQGGITFSMSEWGNVRRDTVNYRVTLPFLGDAALLLMAPTGGAAYVPAESVRADGVVQTFYYVIGQEGPEQFSRELRQWLDSVTAGASKVAAEVEKFNATLPLRLGNLIEEHIARVDAANAFTTGLPFAVSRRTDAPPAVVAPPVSAVKREVPRTGGLPSSQPALGKYFDDIVAVLGSALRAIERSPGRYSGWQEEELRDSLLVMLNAQFQGAAVGEAFNASGKTDLLIRAEDNNLFIGECKIWAGAKEFDRAIEQLLSYSTWRDSRLALIIFVRTRNMAETVEKGRAVVSGRAEFEHWITGTEGSRAHIRWPDDRARTATLALLWCHLQSA